MIKQGYILQPRIIKESDISKAPPYIREIWNYLLREANSSENHYGGHKIMRGQLFRDYKSIREDLSWYIGYRREMYNENHTKKAMKFLRDTGRITTTKELGGVLITITNYDHYQNPKNYERTTENTNERTASEPTKNHPIPDNNKNDKNKRIMSIGERKQIFVSSLEPLFETYGKEMIDEFSDYWTEHSPNGRKMRFEKEKVFDIARRLAQWNKNKEKYEKIKRTNRNSFDSDTSKCTIGGIKERLIRKSQEFS